MSGTMVFFGLAILGCLGFACFLLHEVAEKLQAIADQLYWIDQHRDNG